MYVLQSDFYRLRTDVKEATDNILSWSLDAVMKSQLVVEVCERMHDYWTDFSSGGSVQRPKYHACIQGEEGYWGCGRNIEEAIDALARSHPERFDGKQPLVVWCGRLVR